MVKTCHSEPDSLESEISHLLIFENGGFVKLTTDEEGTETKGFESDFGKGLVYCLGLFLAHAERPVNPEMGEKSWMWFNGASDHLYELVTDAAPDHLRQRCAILQGRCLEWGHGDRRGTADDIKWALQEAKDLLREIDLAHGVPAIKGRWE